MTFSHPLKALLMKIITNKEKKRKREKITIVLTTKIKKEMGKLTEGLKIAAYVAEIVMASAVVIELVGKCGGKVKTKTASVETGADNATEAK